MSTPASISREKKILRDRRAQIARRARQSAYTLRLEQQVELCIREHSASQGSDTAALYVTLDALRLENAELRRRQAAVLDLLAPRRPPTQNSEGPVRSYAGVSCSSGDKAADPIFRDDAGTGIGKRIYDAPTYWTQRPIHTPYDAFVETLMPWLMCPDVVLPLSDLPSPTDLLSGTRENPLANSIYMATTFSYSCKLAKPERLAIGWMIYVYTKWLLHPTPARYARLPEFLRPTDLQKSRAHAAPIDVIVWPQLRNNLITTCTGNDDLFATLSFFASELKVSWPTDAPLLEPDERNPSQLVICKGFFESFHKLGSWTLSPAFVEGCPNVLQGMLWTSATNSAELNADSSTRARLRVTEHERPA